MFIIKSVLDDGENYYWQKGKGWIAISAKASRFKTSGDAIRELASQREESGEPLDFVCGISIERQMN